MSFIFEIRLSPPQINMLMFFVKAAKKQKQPPMPKYTYSSTALMLVKEGLLKCKKHPKLQEPTEWKVTKKGFLLASIIQEEVKELKVAKIDNLCWYDLPKEVSQCRGISGSEPSGVINQEGEF